MAGGPPHGPFLGQVVSPTDRNAGRRQWERDHGRPWSESDAGKRASASGVEQDPEETPSSSTSTSRNAPGFLRSTHKAVTSGSGGTVAGAMLGILVFFTGRAYLQGGFAGVRAFYAAKFLNKTTSTPNQVPVNAQGTVGAAVAPPTTTPGTTTTKPTSTPSTPVRPTVVAA